MSFGKGGCVPEIYDDDELPHIPVDADTDGVPYMNTTCGQDGEWWPCAEARRQGVTHD